MSTESDCPSTVALMAVVPTCFPSKPSSPMSATEVSATVQAGASSMAKDREGQVSASCAFTPAGRSASPS